MNPTAPTPCPNPSNSYEVPLCSAEISANSVSADFLTEVISQSYEVPPQEIFPVITVILSINEKSFLESVLLKTLAEPGNEELIAKIAKNRVIIEPPFSKNLFLYCCPDGKLHDFEVHIETEDKGPADDDDMKAHRYSEYTIRTCKACGYQRISVFGVRVPDVALFIFKSLFQP